MPISNATTSTRPYKTQESAATLRRRQFALRETRAQKAIRRIEREKAAGITSAPHQSDPNKIRAAMAAFRTGGAA